MNPFVNPVDNGQSAGVSPANPINDPSFHSNQGSNTFDLSYQNLLTARYGEITPFFYMEGLGRDRIELRSSHDLRTYTLGAPLMSGLRMRKSNFSVSFKSMMPNSWNYLFVNPVKGDDVPDDAYCAIDICGLISRLLAKYVPESTSASDKFKLFALLCTICSPGSLLDSLGVTLNTLINAASGSIKNDVYDGFSVLDNVCDAFVKGLAHSNTPVIKYNVADPTSGELFESEYVCDSSLSSAFELFTLVTQHPDCTIEFDKDVLTTSGVTSFMSTLNSSRYFSTHSLVINLYKVVAYQMIVSQFFSNDHVDSVYNSELWLSNQKSLVYSVVKTDTDRVFDYNGILIYYDVYSLHMLTKMFTAFSGVDISSPLYFFFNTFAFRRSLRYGDYFMSSRPLPLAVGDVSIPVTGNKVSVIDVNKNLHIQRFLNAVNRVGSNLVDYAKSIFGFTPSESDSLPRFISSEVVYVGSDEIENTAQSQGTINVNMVAQQSNYMFDIEISDPCIILGLLSFECTGAYRSSIERDNFHVNRFDSFIPELQHIGDQQVFQAERAGLPTTRPFGYQVRYAEYKFKYNQMHGGFTTDALKNWAFPVVIDESHVINEDSIRSRPSEFDVYYKSLTGASFSSRFHFQISMANNVRANRAMDYQPTLL